MSENLEALLHRARRDYLANVIEYQGRRYLTAGSSQFHTLWVRDFCYSVPGLLSQEEPQLVENQLDLIFYYLSPEGILPRGLDVINPKTRVVLNSVFRFLPQGLRKPGYEGGELTAEYEGEHGTMAFDSLLLVPWALTELCLYWQKRNSVKADAIIKKYEDTLQRIFFPLKAAIKDGLFFQDEFSDWQDSTRREGAIFTTHILFLRLLNNGKKLGLNWFAEIPWPSEEQIFHRFFRQETGLFVNGLGNDGLKKQFSFEAHLWVLQDKLFSGYIDHEKLFRRLKETALWQEHLGVPVYPASAASEVAWTTKIVGLRKYHDGMVWSWLLAEAYKTCIYYGDVPTASRIKTELEITVKKDGCIFEVYERKSSNLNGEGNLRPVKTLLYQSEHPFSWGACKWLEALTFQQQ
ncbi:MAG: hypothetical protein V4736_10870 [Bdellovibrionota bacterium]